MLHCREELIEKAFGFFGLLSGALEQPWEKIFRQQLHAVGKKAEHELIDEMRNLFGGAAALQAVRYRGEFIGCLTGDCGAGLGRPQLLRVKKYRMENVEVLRLGQFVERELVGFRNRVGPRRANDKSVGVAGHLERRVFESRRIAHELGQRSRRDRASSSYIPSEKLFLPDIGETVAAACLRRPPFRR